jgi:HSP20 family protein
MDEMSSFFSRIDHKGRCGHEFTPQLDIYETADAYVVEVDLPGFSEKDFTVSMDGTTLRLEGVKRQDKGERTMSYICLERHFGRFRRSVEVPAEFAADAVRATYERGVLVVAFPRLAVEEGRIREVPIAQGE